MASHFCHPCSLELRLVGSGLPSNLSASSYQAGKFLKHTVPSKSAQTTGVFSDPSYVAYAEYLINAEASGSVEVDDSGRTNVVWYAGKAIGASWMNGDPVLPNDTVKLVLSHHSQKVHGFSITSTDYVTHVCSKCGRRVLV